MAEMGSCNPWIFVTKWRKLLVMTFFLFFWEIKWINWPCFPNWVTGAAPSRNIELILSRRDCHPGKWAQSSWEMALICACAMCGPDNFGNKGTAHDFSAIPRFPYVLLGVWCHLLQLKQPCGKHYRIFGNNGEKVVGLKLVCLFTCFSKQWKFK